MDVEREQARLLRLMNEVLTDVEFDDETDEGEGDNLEEREDGSDTEQDLDFDTDSDSPDEDLCFVGKDQTTKWKKDAPRKNIRTKAKNIIKHLPGPVGPVKGLTELIDIWTCLIDDTILNIVVENTNKSIDSVLDNYSRSRNAQPTTLPEVKALFGLLYLAGTRKANHLNAEDLWKTNGTAIESFRLTMSLYRFRFLLRHLRFDDKNTRADKSST